MSLLQVFSVVTHQHFLGLQLTSLLVLLVPALQALLGQAVDQQVALILMNQQAISTQIQPLLYLVPE